MQYFSSSIDYLYGACFLRSHWSIFLQLAFTPGDVRVPYFLTSVPFNLIQGEAGKVPTAKELVLALQNHDLFLYFGHGSGMSTLLPNVQYKFTLMLFLCLFLVCCIAGMQYIPGKEIHKLEKCAAMLLMGCSSGSLTYRGSYAPRGAPLSYLFAGSPAVIANLWEVTDKDIDRFGKAMLKSWLQEEPLSALENCTRCNQLVKEFGCLKIDEGRKATIPKSRRKAIKSKKLQDCADKGRCKICGAKRITSFMSEARDACKLPFLIGASPVCYGVPTVILKKS